jgi:hypothetical protein
MKIARPGARQRDFGSNTRMGRPKTVVRLGLMGLVVALGACAAGATQIPPPRPIIIHSGARIVADHEKMIEVNEWVTREQRNIEEDPSFMVVGSPVLDENFPWEGMVLGRDSVTLRMPLGGQDGQLVYQLYGHLHLMVQMGRQAEWLPEAPDAVGYDLERAIVSRIADAWILGRTVFDTQPFGPLDELAYAKDAGYLDAFIFTARPDDFAAARAEWARANPDRREEYRDWFLDTFNREPPGIRTN